MAEFLRAPLLRSEAAPEVTDFGPANRAQEIAYSGFSQAFRALAEQAFPVAAEERKREGAAAAQADVESGDFSVRRSAFTVRDREYNRAGLEMSAGRIETAAIEKTLELSRTHRADPAGFMANLRAYAAGVRSEVMPLNPELAESLHNRIIERAAPYIERLGANASADLRDASEAAMIELDARTTALMDDHARHLFDKDPAVAKAAGDAIDKMVAEWMTQFDRVDPNTGKPVFTAKERAEGLLQIQRRAVEVAAIQYLSAADDLGEAATLLANGELKLSVAGQVDVDVTAFLDPLAAKRVMVHAQSLLNARTTAAAAEEARADKTAERLSEATRFTWASKFTTTGPEPADLKMISDQVAAGLMTPADGEAMLKMAETYLSEDIKTDREFYDRMLAKIYGGDSDPTREILDNPGMLSKEDMAGLLTRARTRFDAPPETDLRKKYETQLEKALTPEGAFGDPEPAALSRRVDAMDEYFQRVYVGGEDPQTVFQDLRARAGGRGEKPFDATDTSYLLEPRFSVYGRTDDGKSVLDVAETLKITARKAREENWPAERINREVELIYAWARAQGVELPK